MKFEWTIRKRQGRFRPKLTVRCEFDEEEAVLNPAGEHSLRIIYHYQEQLTPGPARGTEGWRIAWSPIWDTGKVMTEACHLEWKPGIRPEYPEVVAELSALRTAMLRSIEEAADSAAFELSDADEFRMVSTRHPQQEGQSGPSRRIKVAEEREAAS